MTQSVVLDKQVVEKSKMVACNVQDSETRKRAYALNIAANTVAKHLNTEFGIEVDTKYSLFRISSFVKNFEIADIYIDGLRLDVRISFDSKTFSIPKVHEKYNVNPLAYLVIGLDDTLENAQILGFIPQKELEKRKSDTDYVCYENDILKPIQELKDFVSQIHFIPQIFPVADHEKIKELAISFIDDEISASEKIYFIKHVIECPVCRELFCDMNDFDVIVSQLKNYEELLNDSTLSFLSGNQEEIADAAIAQIATFSDNQTNEIELEKDTSYSINTTEVINDVVGDIVNTQISEDSIELETSEQESLPNDIEDFNNLENFEIDELQELNETNEETVFETENTQNNIALDFVENSIDEIENNAIDALEIVENVTDEIENLEPTVIELADEFQQIEKNIEIENNTAINELEFDINENSTNETNIEIENNIAIDELEFDIDENLTDETNTNELLDIVTEENIIEQNEFLSEDENKEITNDLEFLDNELDNTNITEEYSKPMGVSSIDNHSVNIELNNSDEIDNIQFADDELILEHHDDITIEDIHENLDNEHEELLFIEDEHSLTIDEFAQNEDTELIEIEEEHNNSLEQAITNTSAEIELKLEPVNHESFNNPETTQEFIEEDAHLGLEDLEMLDVLEETENSPLENIIEAVDTDDDLTLATQNNIQQETIIQSSYQEPIELVYDDEEDEEENESNKENTQTQNEEQQENVLTENNDSIENETNNQVDNEIQNLLDNDLLALLCDDNQDENTNSVSDNNINPIEIEQNTTQVIEQNIEENYPQQKIAQNTHSIIEDTTQPNTEMSNNPMIDIERTTIQTDNVQTLFNNEAINSQNTQPNFELAQEPISQKTMNTTKRILITLVFLFVLASGGIITWFAHNAKNNADENSFDTNKNDEFFDSQNNVKKPDEIMPAISQDINKSMTNSFSDKPAAITITKLSWQVSEKLATETSVKEYLQTAGKNIQLNLQNDLAKSADVNFNNLVKVSLTIAPDNTLKALQILESSGSDQIDDIVSRSLKNTLKLIPVPKLKDNKSDYLLTLVINF